MENECEIHLTKAAEERLENIKNKPPYFYWYGDETTTPTEEIIRREKAFLDAKRKCRWTLDGNYDDKTVALNICDKDDDCYMCDYRKKYL